MAWTLGFIYVGNGTNGTTNAVLFQTNTGTYIAGAETHSAVIPIVGGDSQLGKSYINDVQKHFGRKVIKKMWLHLDALVPSTGSAMMIAVAPIRGVGQCSKTIFYPLATAGATANALDSVLSCKDAITCDSFEHKTLDITAYIAGGSGPLQNEFNVSAPYEGTTSPGTTIVISSNDEGDSNFSLSDIVPACIVVGGNNTVAAYQGVQMYEVVIEQEVDLLDYVGGFSDPVNIV